MESDMARAHGHHYNQDFVESGEGGAEEAAPEKVSVFKRMKAKARKMKDSIGHKMQGGHGNVHDHEDEESDDDEVAQPETPGAPPVYDSERSRNFATAQEGKPTGPLAEEVDQNVCPGTFQTKVTDPVHHDPPTATPRQFGGEDELSSETSKPKVTLGQDYPGSTEPEPKQAPSDFDAHYGEHWGSLEATSGNDSGLSKPTSGGSDLGRLNATSDDYNSEAFNATPKDFTSGRENAASGGFKSGNFNSAPLEAASNDFDSEPFKANSGDPNSGRLNAPSDDYNSETFTAAPKDFTSGQENAALGGFKAGDLNSAPLKAASNDFDSEPFKANSGRLNATSDDYNSEAFNATPQDFTSGQVNAASGGFKSGDLYLAPSNDFESEPFKANSGDFSSESSKALTSSDFDSGRLISTPDDNSTHAFTATPEDFNSEPLNATSGGFKAGDFNPSQLDAKSEKFDSEPLNDGSGDFSSGSLRGASGGFSSFNSAHARTTSGDLNSPLNPPTDNIGSDPLNAPSPQHVSQNYPTETDLQHDIVGSEEARVDPVVSSFAKMGIHGDRQNEPEAAPASGSHDQFCDQVESSPIPESTDSVPPIPVPDVYSPKTEHHPKDMDVDISYPKDADVQDMNVDTVETPAEKTSQGQAGYISSAASAIASKMGYGGNDKSADEAPIHSTDDAVTDKAPLETAPQPQSGYVASATSAALSAKNAVASKLGYGGNDDTAVVESQTDRAPADTSDDVITDRSPLETPQPQAGYMSALAGGAVSAKNAVASRLGYGSTDSAPTSETTRGLDATSAATEPDTTKGGSVKGYISEKLAPGEDDKALSDYISSAIHKPKADEEEKTGTGVGQTVSDAFHKRNTEEDVDSDKPMGKVTESDQVASRLGSSESERTGVSSPTAVSPGGTGVVGKFKGAFTNWFGKADETNPSPNSPVHGATEEHGLQKEGGELGEEKKY